MSLGTWAWKLADGNATCEELLDGVPGPLCSKIDEWVMLDRSSWPNRSGPTKLGREDGYTDVDELWAVADIIQDERNAAQEGLEECRTALEALRGALETACGAIQALEAEVDALREDPRKGLADEVAWATGAW